jgi:glycerol kinase
VLTRQDKTRQQPKINASNRYHFIVCLLFSLYFVFVSATKLMYILDTVAGVREDAAKGDALFGTIDTWLIWNLTGGKVHATDVTNASRTLLMNIHTLRWDDALLDLFAIPRAMLPVIKSSSEIYGFVDFSLVDVGGIIAKPFASNGADITGIPISGVLGDQHAALFGQCCFEAGEAKCTYGTGAFLLLNTGPSLVQSRFGLLTTIAFQLGPSQPVVYALEGSCAYCGSLIQWLRDNLQIIGSASETSSLASADNGECDGAFWAWNQSSANVLFCYMLLIQYTGP